MATALPRTCVVPKVDVLKWCISNKQIDRSSNVVVQDPRLHEP